MATRIGVDIGGTFTDLVYYDEQTGQTVEAKVPTTPHAPEQGVLDAIQHHVPANIVASAAYFLHGTTVGLNALLERRGAVVGMLCTAGFRDVLEIRRGDRAEMYNLFWRQPEPLVPRRLRLPVRERMRADGAVHQALEESDVAAALEIFRAAGVTSIAVCFMNAYANPAHERRAEALLRAAGFDGGISLSHRVSGEYREYERTSTTVIDAFVRARMSHYLSRLSGRLRDLGFNGECLITRSGSGSMTFAEAEERPFETIMSGPVAGAEGAGELARTLGIEQLITADVGGTSFDTALVLNGQVQVLYEGVVDGMPVQTPWVDVRSIGAGGGSIAYVDQGGLMRVGPRSSGAVPGPASYGKGGTEPATTDAAFFLGMLGPGKLASGITLDIAKAEAALATVAQAIGRDVQTTATGVLRIAAASMADAIREVTVEQGLDPREMTLAPFGGAGPLMATLLADELQISRIVLPPIAGNFSAWGLLGADMVQSVARTRIMDLTDAALPEVDRLLGELLDELRERRRAEAVASLRLDLRYKGQEHWLSVEVALQGERIAESTAAILDSFGQAYTRAFGGTMEEAVEIVAVRAMTRVQLPQRAPGVASPAAAPAAAAAESCNAWSFERQQRMDFPVVERAAITAPLAGPAIVLESTATLYLDADWIAQPGAHGALILTRKEAA